MLQHITKAEADSCTKGALEHQRSMIVLLAAGKHAPPLVPAELPSAVAADGAVQVAALHELHDQQHHVLPHVRAQEAHDVRVVAGAQDVDLAQEARLLLRRPALHRLDGHRGHAAQQALVHLRGNGAV
jgi:hypothetical protein